MSFAQSIKSELLTKEFSTEQALAFVSGITAVSGVFDKSNTILKFNNNYVSVMVRDILDQLNISFTNSQENRNWIIIDYIVKTDEIKHPSQYFAGVFVGAGSISDPDTTSYHLELQFYSHLNATRVKNFLNKYYFNFSLIQRRKMWVLYLKKSEMITDFLRAVQAFESLIIFEDARINRDFQNQLNRYSNLDVYNQKKLAGASKRFLNAYNLILKKNMTDSFREQELIFFKLKKDNIYSSLEELTEKYLVKTGIKKTRAGLSHYLRKLRSVVEKMEQNKKNKI